MVKDYVTRLYTPAALATRALDGPGHVGAQELATWKSRVRAAWPGVRVDHVKTEGVGEVPQVGDVMKVSAFVSLGDLTPDDVEVQVCYGKVSDADMIARTSVLPLAHVETYEDGRYAFAAPLELDTSGPFGYSVRIVPTHPGMAGVTELGLVANAG
jgi:starch phosphorylase